MIMGYNPSCLSSTESARAQAKLRGKLGKHPYMSMAVQPQATQYVWHVYYASDDSTLWLKCAQHRKVLRVALLCMGRW